MNDPSLNDLNGTPEPAGDLPVPPREPEFPALKELRAAFELFEPLVWAVFFALVIFVSAVRPCRVDGRSMENTLSDGQSLFVTNLFYTPAQDDVIVFQSRKSDGTFRPLVKRVVAVGGQTVVIDFNTDTVTVDGEVYEDAHHVLKHPLTDQPMTRNTVLPTYNFDAETGIFEATVPENCCFVMGDNRNNSHDSRADDIGFVDCDRIVGKVFFRLAPVAVF